VYNPKNIDEIAGSCLPYFLLSITRDRVKASVSIPFNEDALEDVHAMDGKWLLYATDSSLSAADVVTQYLEKDFLTLPIKI